MFLDEAFFFCVLQFRGCWSHAASVSHVISFTVSSPASCFFCFSVSGSVHPHPLPKVAFLSLGLPQGSRNAIMSGQQSLLSHRYRAVLTLGRKPLPKGWNGWERGSDVGENEARLHALPEEMQEGLDSALLKEAVQLPWMRSVATSQFLFSCRGGKTGFSRCMDSPAKLLHAVDPQSDTSLALNIFCCFLSLNTPLLLSPGFCSWTSQGSYKSNFRTYSNFWCWGDENSPSAHSQRISSSKVRSFLLLTSCSFLGDYLPPEDLQPYGSCHTFCSVLGQAQCLPLNALLAVY